MIRVVSPRTHEHRLRVRYAETDQMGVVYHANYLVYMEEGRTRLMRELGAPYSEVERRGWALVVRRATVRYRGSARYDDELVVRTRLEHVGRASVTFGYEVLRDGEEAPLAEGSTELACVGLQGSSRRPAPLPAELRALLERGQDGTSPE